MALLLPVLVFLENVGGLAKTDRAYVIEQLVDLGYIVATVVSDLQHHGVPCRRSRVWFIACLQPWATAEDRARIQASAVKYEVLLRQSAPFDLSSFLLMPGDRDFEHHMQDHLSKRQKNYWDGMKWTKLHKKLWLEHRRKPRWPPAMRAMFRTFPFTTRERDALRLELARRKGTDNDKYILCDVSQAADRLPRGVGVSPTILPKGKVVICSGLPEPRPLLGIESLKLQGFDLDMLSTEKKDVALSSFNGGFYADAAGNAFSVPQCQLAFLIALCIFELPASISEVAERRCAATAHSLFA